MFFLGLWESHLEGWMRLKIAAKGDAAKGRMKPEERRPSRQGSQCWPKWLSAEGYESEETKIQVQTETLSRLGEWVWCRRSLNNAEYFGMKLRPWMGKAEG
jgi:hypothetical protein